MTRRPIWKGTISFGLVSIPVMLFSAEAFEQSHFHMLDKKNNSRIRYERINELTGKKVPWENIVKAYEFEKDNYVILDEKVLESTDVPEFKTIEILNFVDKNSIEYPYFDKPYYLVPTEQGMKAYNLLFETLKRNQKAGIAQLMIKTKQHIAAIFPFQSILLLNLLRYEDEIKKPDEFYKIDVKQSKIIDSEIKLAEQLVKSMSTKWVPKKYHNKSKEILLSWIEQKIKKGKTLTVTQKEMKSKKGKGEVVDFMELLKRSVKDKQKK